MNRILIGALSGWQHAPRRRRCASTWFPAARAAGMEAVFLLGVQNIPASERWGDALLLPCPDAYETLPQRTRAFCRWALSADCGYAWDYLFKCDDDSFVAAERLAGYDTAGRDYIGAEWRPGVGYGSGGGGYLLSRRAAAIVTQELTQPSGAEDLLVGQVLSEAGMRLSIEPRLVPFGSMARRPRPDNDLMTVHGVEADVFLRSHSELSRELSPATPQEPAGVR